MGFGASHNWQAPVVAGHFSKSDTLNVVPAVKAGLPATVLWRLTGTISGNRASRTMRWSFTGTNKDACAPSSGKFTWRATNRGKIGTA
jgi:hypothetical protein